MLGAKAFLIFILCSIALLIVYLIAIFCASAILFSRVAFSLVVAFLVSQGDIMLVASSGGLNYIAWAMVVMGIVYLLSMLPRVDMALKFFCNILLSVVLIEVVIVLFGSIIAAVLKTEFVFSTAYEVLIKIICTLFSLVYMYVGKKPHYDSPKNFILYNLERVLASLLYGTAITFLFVSLNQNWELPILVILLLWIVGTVGAFVADIYLAGKDIFGLEESEEITMPK